MSIGLGRRARNVAIMASALSALVGSLPGQPLRDQIKDIATMIAEDAEDVADELEEGDRSLLPDDVRAA